jgi:hypothetical protein
MSLRWRQWRLDRATDINLTHEQAADSISNAELYGAARTLLLKSARN